MERPHYYILDGKIAKSVADTVEWAKRFEGTNRCVAKTTLGDARVSTVFLGRYSTWEQAEVGHKAMVARVKEE